MGPAEAMPTAAIGASAARIASAIIAATDGPNLFGGSAGRGGTDGGVHERATGIGQARGDFGAADVQAESEHGDQCRWVLSGWRGSPGCS